MPSAVITSALSNTTLELAVGPNRRPYHAQWSVKLETPSVVATHAFWGSDPGSLVAFFDDLASNWRGWDGRREWTELERELGLIATHDGLGHVLISVTLGKFIAPPLAAWMVQVPLQLDAGELDSVAAQARLLLVDD